MKKKVIYLLGIIMFMSFVGMAQDKKTESFKVFGNCDMCKEKIEGALKKKDGVISKKWDKDSKMLTVSYDGSKISIKDIGKRVADVGYDNEYARATDEAYRGLHSCCKYERAKKGK